VQAGGRFQKKRDRPWSRRVGCAKAAGLVIAAMLGVASVWALQADARSASVSITLSVPDLRYASATLQGSASSPDVGFHVVIEWGPTTSYGSQDVFNTSNWYHQGDWATYPTWLDRDTTYHARMVLHLEDGQTLYSPDVVFHTKPNPVPTVLNSDHNLVQDGGGSLMSGVVGASAAFDTGYATATASLAWGTTPSLATTTPVVMSTPDVPSDTGGEPQAVGFGWSIGSACSSNVTYYWRYVVSNSAGVTTTPTESVSLGPLRSDVQAACSGTTTTTTTTSATTTTISTKPPRPPATSTAATTTTNGTTTTTPPPAATTTTTSPTQKPPVPKSLLPNRTRTPGATNAAVTQKTIKTTICVSGWTAKVRPPVSFTNTLKLKQMKQYGETGKPTAYEEDHLIPLELGGAPRNPKNLWPEPHKQSKHSDPLETSLKRKVCAGVLTLAQGRAQILAYKGTHG
jgi:hypothetical protein